MIPLDEKFMKAALREAEKAYAKDEVPIGAVAVTEGKIVARAHNIRELTQDPLGHAEILLLKKLSRKLGSWRLPNLTIYVTLEPCLMCMGALLQARIHRLVFGVMDPKAGACGSLYDLSRDLRLNHRFQTTKGVLAADCLKILKAFFVQRRRARALK